PFDSPGRWRHTCHNPAPSPRYSMSRLSLLASLALLLAACGQPESASAPSSGDRMSTSPAASSALGSGVELENFNRSLSPGSNFYEYVNGTWLANTPIPADKSNYGAFTVLADEAE